MDRFFFSYAPYLLVRCHSIALVLLGAVLVLVRPLSGFALQLVAQWYRVVGVSSEGVLDKYYLSNSLLSLIGGC